MKNKSLLIATIILVLATIFLIIHERKEKPLPIDVTVTADYNYKVIKQIDKEYNTNYLISPLSIGYALSMLNDGADGATKEQITKYLNNFKAPKIFDAKNRIIISNALFIRNDYKDMINNNFTKNINSNYGADVIYDDFKTAKVMNDWVKEKTYNMIDKISDSLDPDFVMGVANAIAIDVEWNSKFECHRTKNEEFTLSNGNKMNTAMMHSTDDITYIENNNAKGIIKDYAIYDKKTGERVYEEKEDTISLEYIAILPNKSINEYIDLFDENELKDLLNNKKTPSKNLEINLSIPKYTYDFTYGNFKSSLIKAGVTDAFNQSLANFNNIIPGNRIYISDAIHKTHIEFSENGTKAAAVTAFLAKDTALIRDEKEKINIEFNKPFIYIIKEKNKDNIWFFGTVYEPMKFEDNDNNC